MKARTPHNFRRDKRRTIVRVFFVALLFIGIGLLLPKAFMLAGRIVLYPVQVTQHWYQQSTARFPMFLKDRNDLIRQIEALKSKLAAAEGSDVTQQRLSEENLWLRDLLAVDGRERIAAAVIARPNELPYDLLQIDRGEEDGIKIGAPVYVGSDNVIGIVSQLAPHYGFVRLFSTPGFKTTAYISGANVIATLEGYGGGVARVSVPQGISLTVGDLVHVPSIDPGVFGRIDYIENRPSQPEQYGYVTLRKPIGSINYVAVGKEPLTPVAPEVLEDRIAQTIIEALHFDGSKLSIASTTVTGTTTSTTRP